MIFKKKSEVLNFIPQKIYDPNISLIIAKYDSAITSLRGNSKFLDTC